MLILYRKTNANFINQAHFILENQCKSHSFDQLYVGKPIQTPYSDTHFSKFGTSKMLILGRKTSKIAVFEKMLILGRRTCQTRFFTKKSKFKKLTLKFSFQGIKCKKGFIFESIFSKRALQIVYIGKPMQISLTKLIFYWKTNANRTHYAHFILENRCKFH